MHTASADLAMRLYSILATQALTFTVLFRVHPKPNLESKIFENFGPWFALFVIKLVH